MKKAYTPFRSEKNTEFVNNELFFWKIVQFTFWLIGIGLLAAMLFIPTVGVTLFWNILIPVAPALLVIATGIWRNVCPLATTGLIPDRLGLSRRRKLSNSQRSLLNLIGVIVLFLIIPLRHVVFNRSGHWTAIIIISLAFLAFITGLIYERKSVWCSGLCPVHPVEQLYGSGPAFSPPNTQCKECVKCSIPCPESTKNTTILTLKHRWSQTAIEYILVGAFPGYVWGWFHLPDYTGASGWNNLKYVYGIPLLSAAISVCLYIILKQIVSRNRRKFLVNLFAATAVSCYYWFRLPQLMGFGSGNTNGELINLSSSLPAWSPIVMNIFTTTFFIWWMTIRKKAKRSWTIRPAYAQP